VPTPMLMRDGTGSIHRSRLSPGVAEASPGASSGPDTAHEMGALMTERMPEIQGDASCPMLLVGTRLLSRLASAARGPTGCGLP
jgi:hypothetical protein